MKTLNDEILNRAATSAKPVPMASPYVTQAQLDRAFPAQVAEGDAKDALNEATAKALYETWQGMTGYVPWQDGGNSFMQDQARRAAIASQKGPA